MQVLWNTLIGAVPLGGKNHQQIQTAVAKQVKKYQKLLEAFSGSARLEAALMVHIQVHLQTSDQQLAAAQQLHAHPQQACLCAPQSPSSYSILTDHYCEGTKQPAQGDKYVFYPNLFWWCEGRCTAMRTRSC
jgi:hypothetical protein